MKIKYDFHMHSGLSPCADKDMTPANIVGFALLNGLNMIAISDHNSISNVKTAIEIGKAYGVVVVPALELQTLEDVHLLCLFPTYEQLEDFYNNIEFFDIKNKPEIYGEQIIFDEDDNIIGYEDKLLLNAVNISTEDTPKKVDSFGGIAIPAHIDREGNGMVAILGGVDDSYRVVELSTSATKEQIENYSKQFMVLVDSDAHTLNAISTTSQIDIDFEGELSPKVLIDYLKGEL